jgi:antitoxin component of MazEF toxin-antitoxin module
MYKHLEINMSTTTVTNFQSRVLPWGNGLGLRLTKTLANAAGVDANSPVNITVEPGRIIIETAPKKLSLTEMLNRFDPQRHGGEAMAFAPLGKEAM